MKTAAAYIRVSTDDQVEYSPASQLEKIREYAKRNEYILPDEYVYMDEGISGRHTAKRAAFNKMIGTAKQKPKPFDAILLWKFSRFARNREDSIVYKSMLRKQCGIDVISISENVGDDKMSVLIEALIEAMDEYYSINLSEEVKRGMTEKVNRGEAVSIPSYGYQIQDGRYVPDPETAPVVRRIFTDFINGKGLRTISVEINDSGRRTRRGNRFENRTIKYILQNPVYIGKIRWTPTGRADHRTVSDDTLVIDGNHEPLIDQELWQQAQDKINMTSRTKYMRHSDPKEPFMLQGLVRCSACGATLTRSASHTSLQCYAYAHGKCNTSHSISISKLNDMILIAIENAAVSGDFKLSAKPRAESRQPDNTEAMLAKEQKKLDRIKDAYENEVYTLDEYKSSREQILKRISELQQKQVTGKRDEADDRRLIQDRLTNLLPSLRSPATSESTKNALLKSVVDRVVFYRSTSGIDVFFYA